MQKRLACAQALHDPARIVDGNREKVKTRLRSLRASALEDMDASLQCLKSVCENQDSRDFIYAGSAIDATHIIGSICGETRKVAINKSAVVSGELAPILAAAGFQVLTPYYDDLSDIEVRFAEGWQLPEIPFAMRYHAFEREDDILAKRQINIHEKGARDLVAVIGVNAVSAADGGAVLLQHRQNIGQMFMECREIILVAGIDKVLSTMDDAVFQTKLMAWFGTDSLALGLGRKSAPHVGLESYPFTIPPDRLSSKFTLILLDNGRRKMMERDSRELLLCIGCRACIKTCPGSRFFDEETLISPRELLFLSLLNIDRPLDRCLQCKNCRAACPVDIDLPGMILNLRLSRNKQLLPAPSDWMLANAEEVERMGSLFAPIANVLLKNRLIKQLSQLACGIDSRRALPSFATKTFERIYRESQSGSGQ